MSVSSGKEQLVKRITDLVRKEVDKLHRDLVEEGVDPEIVEKVFGSYEKNSKFPTKKSKSGELVIVEDYGPKTVALFGDNKTVRELCKNHTFVSYNRNLVFGNGALLKDKSKLEELINILKKESLKIVMMTREEYEKSAKNELSLKESREVDDKV